MGGFNLDDYVDVPERIRQFREQHPEGTLQSEILPLPESFAAGFVAVKAYAYRTPDDPRPGVGIAWEKVPGATPYTKESELMNAETSAWGRAIVAVGAADTKRGIASKNEVASRQPQPRSSSGKTAESKSANGGSIPPRGAPPVETAPGFHCPINDERGRPCLRPTPHGEKGAHVFETWTVKA